MTLTLTRPVPGIDSRSLSTLGRTRSVVLDISAIFRELNPKDFHSAKSALKGAERLTLLDENAVPVLRGLSASKFEIRVVSPMADEPEHMAHHLGLYGIPHNGTLAVGHDKKVEIGLREVLVDVYPGTVRAVAERGGRPIMYSREVNARTDLNGEHSQVTVVGSFIELDFELRHGR